VSADDVAAVREALESPTLPRAFLLDEALAALDRLAARLQEAERERDDWETRSDVVVETMERYKSRAETAEHNYAELGPMIEDLRVRTQATEAREAALRHELAEAKGAMDEILNEAKAREAALRGAVNLALKNPRAISAVIRAAFTEKP